MESQRFSRRLRGLAPEEREFQERCFFCLVILTINSLTSSLTTHLACCGKYVHERCQKQWETVSNTCAHCKQRPRPQHQEEPQRLVAREALRQYRENNDEIRSGMNFPYRIHMNCWTAYWQALDQIIADYGAVDHRRHIIRLTVMSRNELNLFERMAFLRLIDSCTPVSVRMFFNSLEFRFDYINSLLFPEDVVEFGYLRIGVAVV